MFGDRLTYDAQVEAWAWRQHDAEQARHTTKTLDIESLRCGMGPDPYDFQCIGAAWLFNHNAILADMADRVFTLSDGRIVNARSNPHRGSVRDLAW